MSNPAADRVTQSKVRPIISIPTSLLGVLISCTLVLSVRTVTSAQPLQPTNQVASDVANPQTQPSAQLGAPITPLQSGAGPQVLGAASGQSGLTPLRIATSQSPAVAVDAPSNEDTAVMVEPSTPPDSGNMFIMVAAGMFIVLALAATYWAAKRKISR